MAIIQKLVHEQKMIEFHQPQLIFLFLHQLLYYRFHVESVGQDK